MQLECHILVPLQSRLEVIQSLVPLMLLLWILLPHLCGHFHFSTQMFQFRFHQPCKEKRARVCLNFPGRLPSVTTAVCFNVISKFLSSLAFNNSYLCYRYFLILVNPYFFWHPKCPHCLKQLAVALRESIFPPMTALQQSRSNRRQRSLLAMTLINTWIIDISCLFFFFFSHQKN